MEYLGWADKVIFESDQALIKNELDTPDLDDAVFFVELTPSPRLSACLTSGHLADQPVNRMTDLLPFPLVGCVRFHFSIG